MSILQVTKISCLLLIGILPYTYGSWECSFQHGKCSWSTGYEQCSWKWTSKQLDGAKGYMVSTGQNRCTSEMTWQAAMFGEDGKPFSFLYRINGNGKVKLTVICAEYGVLSDTYHTRWTCNASPAHGWTKAHINCNYRLDKIIINAEFLGKANVMIGKIWNENGRQTETSCPPVPHTTTQAPTTTTLPITTTTPPTTTTQNSTKMFNTNTPTHKTSIASTTNNILPTTLLHHNTNGHKKTETTPVGNKVTKPSKGFTVYTSGRDNIISYSTTESSSNKFEKLKSNLHKKRTLILASIFGTASILTIAFVIVWSIRRSKKLSKLLDDKTPVLSFDSMN
eukprot:XP_014779121.1 PREDICTED: uncharacterized protein LOC106875480 [Octopus bimaculoides]